MSNQIHPTAILEGQISLGSGNFIGPYAVLRGNISIGNNNVISAGTILENNVVIGDECMLSGNVTIGGAGEMGLKGDRLNAEAKVIIGHHVTIRELVTIHSPVYHPETRIDDHAYLMNKSYVAHDCVIGAASVLSAGVMLGGRVVLEQGVTIGMGAAIHQRCVVGQYVMVGMLTPVTRDLPPFATVAGNPARIIGFNKMGAERRGFDASLMDEMERYYQDPILVYDADNPMIHEIMAFYAAHPEALNQFKHPA